MFFFEDTRRAWLVTPTNTQYKFYWFELKGKFTTITPVIESYQHDLLGRVFEPGDRIFYRGTLTLDMPSRVMLQLYSRGRDLVGDPWSDRGAVVV